MDINKYIKYDSVSGKLYWKNRAPEDFKSGYYKAESLCKSWNNRWANKEAFTAVTPQGYYTGALFSKQYLAHRVIWKIVYGYWPDQVDHINGNRKDNSLINLRETNSSGNSRNSRLRSDNKTGYHGIYPSRSGKWWCRIKVGSEVKHLGTFDSLEIAIKARLEAEVKYGYHENHGK
jgi:hypothetical protein